MNASEAVRAHWPEYLIEAWALGMFMISAAVVATLLESPTSAFHQAIPDAQLRLTLAGIAMGLTAIALIYSPWGKRSGAHMNPSVTLAFLRIGKIKPWDAVFYIGAQFLGGTLGVLVGLALLGEDFANPPVSHAITLPGAAGVTVAFVAEFAISALMMAAVLTTSASPRLAPFTGLIAGLLVAIYIAVEAPLSGMSMNPARSFASAAPAMHYQHLWIYLTAPVLGMVGVAQWAVMRANRMELPCAKLVHSDDVRCIHCGYEPPGAER